MASAKKVVTVIEPEKVIPAVTDEKIVIELTRDEAAALLLVSGQIGGLNESREVFSNKQDSLYDILANALGVVPHLDAEGKRYHDFVEGTLKFNRAIKASDYRSKPV